MMDDIFGITDRAVLTSRLRKPQNGADVILDTDAYNEIDDQFALAYLVRSEPYCRVKAVTAAPFFRDPSSGRVQRSNSPAEGMERSYQEILKVLKLLGRSDLDRVVYRGAVRYLEEPSQPSMSEAATKIIEISQAYSVDNPLYVVAIGVLTNIASALLLDPSLRERIVVIWLGGHGQHFKQSADFNMEQDVYAARVVFSCGVPLVQLPCLGVVSEFRFTRVELEHLFRGKNALCDYLIDNTYAYVEKQYEHEIWSKPLWDVAAVAWLMPGELMLDRIVPTMVPQKDFCHSINPDGLPMLYVYYVKKDAITADLVNKLTK